MNKNSNGSQNRPQGENQNSQVTDDQESKQQQMYEKVDQAETKIEDVTQRTLDNTVDTADDTIRLIDKERQRIKKKKEEKKRREEEEKRQEEESDDSAEAEETEEAEEADAAESADSDIAEVTETPQGEEELHSDLTTDDDESRDLLNSENAVEPEDVTEIPESGETTGIDEGATNGARGVNGETVGPEGPTTGLDAVDGATTGAEGVATGAEGATTGAEGITAGTEGAVTGAESVATGAEGAVTGAEGVAAGAEGVAAGAEGAAAAAEAATAAAETATVAAEATAEGVAAGAEGVAAAGEGVAAGIAAGGWVVVVIIAVILLVIAIIIGLIAIFSTNASAGTRTGAIGYEDINPTDEEMFLMYSLAIHERGDGTEEQMSYVVSVVLNRVLTGRYGGDTVRDVIYSPNQFEGVTQVEYTSGHYTSGGGSTWQNQCQAVENYLTTGNTNTVSYPNEAVEKAINATRKVLENGDTTDTPEYPNGGATGFATPYYVLSWSEAGPDHWFQTGGYFGMFNDVDGKEAGTSGHNYNNRNSYSSNFFSSTTDQEILSQYVSVPPTTTTGSNNLINGNIIDTSRPVYIGHQYTNLTETQKRQLAYVAYREQGSIEGAKLELSLMANLTEERRNDYNIYEYVMYSGWFGSANPSHIPQYTSDFTSAYVQLVDEILVNGNRYLTNNINEHDCLSDISSITTGNANNRSNYIPNETVINNVYGARYVFVGFAPNNGDPFGYTL